MTTKRELRTVKELVEHVLETKPKTRNSDTLLYIEACKYLGAKTLDDLEKIKLKLNLLIPISVYISKTGFNHS